MGQIYNKFYHAKHDLLINNIIRRQLRIPLTQKFHFYYHSPTGVWVDSGEIVHHALFVVVRS